VAEFPKPLKSGQLREGDASKFAALRYHIIDGKSTDRPQFAFEQRDTLQDSAGKLEPTTRSVKLLSVVSLMSTFLGTKSDTKTAATMAGEVTAVLTAS